MDNDYVDAIIDAIYAQTELENVRFINAGKTVYNYADLPVDKISADRPQPDKGLDNLLFTVMTVVEAKCAL